MVRLLEVLKQFKPVQGEVDDSVTPSAAGSSSQKLNGVRAIEGSLEGEKSVSNVQDLLSPASTPSEEKTSDSSKLQEESKEEQPEIIVNPKPAVKGTLTR